MYSMTLAESEFLLNQTQLSEPQLARLQQQLAAPNLQRGLTTGMIGERGMGYNTFQHVNSLADINALEGMGSGDWKPNASGRVGRPVDCRKYLELMGEMVEASRQPFPEARQHVDLIEQKLRALAGTRNPLERLKYVVTTLMMPAVGSGVDAFARLEARRNALVAAIAAERHRQQSGSYPAKLDDLVPSFLPAVPSDPFTGQPLRIIAGPDELVIYSVGLNGMDDQGVENENRGEPDLVVRARTAKGSAGATPSRTD
jgi:hypothetical protein